MSWLGRKVTGYSPCLSRDWLLTCTGTMCSPKRSYTVKATIFFLFSQGLEQRMFARLKLSSLRGCSVSQFGIVFLNLQKFWQSPYFRQQANAAGTQGAWPLKKNIMVWWYVRRNTIVVEGLSSFNDGTSIAARCQTRPRTFRFQRRTCKHSLCYGRRL